MTDPIRFTIRAHNAQTDAPTVEDVLAQVGDWNSILRGVEEAIAEDGAIEIEWRVTGASKNSPLALEFTPFPRRHGINIERRTKQVKREISTGLAGLRSRRNGQASSQNLCWKKRKDSSSGSLTGSV